MSFSVNNCHILQMGKKNPKFEYEIGGVKLDSIQCVKDLGVTISSNLKFYLHCKEAACKANGMLGFISIFLSFKNKDIILPYLYQLSQTPSEVCGAILVASPRKDIVKLKAVQRTATKMIPSLRNKSYEERLARLNVFSRETSPPRKTLRVYKC